MSKRLDLIRWKRIEKRLRAARIKRDTLMDDHEIDNVDELIWKLEGQYAGYVLKYSNPPITVPSEKKGRDE